jgi:signal transduction histidine kinase
VSFRARLTVVFLVAALVPLISFAFFVRDEMTKRLTGQYERRVESLITVLEADLEEEGKRLTAALAVMREAAVDDNRFRRAAVDGAPEDRRYLLDYAGNAMRFTGLSMLQIQDANGRIVSSGHFRNEFDRLEPELPKLLISAPGGFALVQARAPDAPFVALARIDSCRMGGRKFYFVAGLRVESRFLQRMKRGADLRVSLVGPGGPLVPVPGAGEASREAGASPGSETGKTIVRELSLPFIETSRDSLASASFRVADPQTDLKRLQNSVNRWFLAAVAATCVIAVLFSTWLASRISRPLMELADKTSRIDLDRLDIDFDSSRHDEIGVLSRLLGAMTRRLRASAVQIKDAERRATLGELARQVNHDIKNGLTPIRNVFRHLTDLSRDKPEELAGVFEERKGTLDSSISYLENLATHYARLSSRRDHQLCHINDIVEQVVMDLRGVDRTYLIQTDLQNTARVNGDPVALRRVIENLVNNAIDSLGSHNGLVKIGTGQFADDSGITGVRIVVADNGSGITEEQRDRIFDDFYTTRETGTGLGLSIVRRLVMDLDGTIRVESPLGPDGGSRFIIEIPAA